MKVEFAFVERLVEVEICPVVRGVDHVGVIFDSQFVDLVEQQAHAGVEVLGHRGEVWPIVIFAFGQSTIPGDCFFQSHDLDMHGIMGHLQIKRLLGGNLLLHERHSSLSHTEDSLGIVGLDGCGGELFRRKRM